MVERDDEREPGKWSGRRPHEEFLELCAVSTSGDLSPDEQRRLQDHVATCAECRQALREFGAVADVGVPLLSSELSRPASNEPRPAPEILEATPAHAVREIQPASLRASPKEDRKRLAFPRRNGNGRTRLNWNYVWLPFAAAVLLTVTLGIYSYEVGKQRNPNSVRVATSATNTTVEALEHQISDAGHEREVLRAQLTERDRTIVGLRHQVEEQSAALSEIRSTEANLAQSLQTNEAEKLQAGQERSDLLQKLDVAQASVQKSQTELDSLRQQRSQNQSRAESLEAQIRDLDSQLGDREQTIDKQEELLAHDRDIRDLMGARDLYIAEVYDVARDGATQKPYGRVFYTKGKSLIFYAYDLDQQAAVKNASTFQAWGRRGPDRQQALNLGIFYQDNAAKKRWVLKFDDANTLEQIDAVFVTVEPNGGSHKPSGKPLLFAYLHLDPNHP